MASNFEVVAREVRRVYSAHKELGQKLNIQLFLLAKCVSSVSSGTRIVFDGWTSEAVSDSSPIAILELVFTREGKVMLTDNEMDLCWFSWRDARSLLCLPPCRVVS